VRASWKVAICNKLNPDITPTTEVHDDVQDNDDVDVGDEEEDLDIGGEVGHADNNHSKSKINFNVCDIVMHTHF
jgi:hypothetical protein